MPPPRLCRPWHAVCCLLMVCLGMLVVRHAQYMSTLSQAAQACQAMARDQDRKVAELSAKNNKWEIENDKLGKDLDVLKKEMDELKKSSDKDECSRERTNLRDEVLQFEKLLSKLKGEKRKIENEFENLKKANKEANLDIKTFGRNSDMMGEQTQDISKTSSGPFNYDSLFQSSISHNQSCVPPKLDPHDPKMMSFYKAVPPINCSISLDWVEASPDGSVLQISQAAEELYGPVSCDWRDVTRDGDFKVKLSTASQSSGYVLNMSDHVLVHCRGKDGHTWDNVLTGLRPGGDRMAKIPDHPPASVEKLNVIILGIDSMSQHNFLRMLTKTSSWLQDHGAVFLSNYNVMGDGTVAALAPLLTGIKEWELPETRRRIKNAQPCDNLPFIWKQFAEAGYVTSFVEEAPSIGAFTYRLTGFTSTPTSHYMRTYYLAQDTFIKQSLKFCYQGTPKHMVNYNHVRQLFKKYPKQRKFYISWANDLSHDDTNNIQAADDDLMALLSELSEDGSLGDTLVMIMSDHGHRFDAIRNTFQGKLEERMPLMSFLFPLPFKMKYPTAFANLQKNAGRLTTALDIHATLKDVLELDGEEKTIFTPKTGVHAKSLSLFGTIPPTRSCSDASIDPHWCACLTWAKLNTSSTLAEEAAAFLLSHVISFTAGKKNRDLCHTFNLGTIVKSSIMAPKKDVLKFQKSVGEDAESVDMNGSSDLEELWIQVEVVLQPGDAVFDATLKYKVKEGIFSVEGPGSVSRISQYQGQADCMDDTALRQWCYCRVSGIQMAPQDEN